MNKSRKHSSCCQSLAPLILTNFLFFNTCSSGYWLWIVIIATTLIGTLSSLGGLTVVVTL
jgi:hypothetical protein